MRQGEATIITFAFFIGSVIYMLLTQNDHTVYPLPRACIRASFYVLLYGAFFLYVRGQVKYTYYSLDIFSNLFLRIYLGFKLILFVFLLNASLPTYVRLLDSKIISLGLSIFVLIFTIALTIFRK